MKAVTSGYLSNRQLEAARKVIIRRIKKVGKIWIRVFPDVPITKKGLEMPMGKGKGDVEIYKAAVRKGKIIFEISGVDRKMAEDILTRAGKKLPVKVRVVEKGEIR
jgi:large subunit ribosomal protein L16